MNKHQRKQIILLGFSAVMLAATVILFLQVFKPNPAFLIGSFETEESLSQIVVFPMEFFSDPKFAALKGRPTTPLAHQSEGLRVNPATPSAPLNITGEAMDVGAQAFLEWEAPLGFADAEYRVYRSEVSGSLGEVVAETKKMSYLDEGLTNGSAYYYTVHTATESGESANAEQVSVYPDDKIPPAAPSNVTIAENTEGGGVVISWVAPLDEDLASMNVYRSDAEGALGELIAGPLAENTYVDTTALENTVHYYTVTAVDQEGNESSTIVLPATGRDNPFLPI